VRTELVFVILLVYFRRLRDCDWLELERRVGSDPSVSRAQRDQWPVPSRTGRSVRHREPPVVHGSQQFHGRLRAAGDAVRLVGAAAG